MADDTPNRRDAAGSDRALSTKAPLWRRLGSPATAALKRLATDAAVAGFPKAGNTWVRVQLEAVGCRMIADLGPFPLARARQGSPRIYLSHFQPFPDEPSLAGVAEALRAFAKTPMIVLWRDPKDTLVSYYFMEALRYRNPCAPTSLREFVFSPAFGIGKLVEWFNVLTASRRGPTRVASYAARLRDPVAVLREDVRFLNHPVPDERLARAVEYASFANMQRMERQSSAENASVPGLDFIPAAPMFVREGKIGAWREHLSQRDGRDIDAFLEENLDRGFLRWIGQAGA